MTKLQFTIPRSEGGVVDPAVPVDVHRIRDFAVVSRSVTGREFSLEPGDYVAVVRLPGGGETSLSFSLGAERQNEPQEVVLENAASAIAAYMRSPRLQSKKGDWTSALPYDFIDFNPFQSVAKALGDRKEFAIETHLVAPNGDGWRFLAVAPQRRGIGPDLGNRTFLFAVPAAEKSRITISLRLDRSGRPIPEFVMRRTAATFLYRYLAEGEAEAASRLSGAAELCANELVENKSEDPISGALGMYLLLLAGRDSEVGSRSEKLYRYNPRLGDGAIIWGEHLARQGRHDEAARILSSIAKRGLPALTFGFRMALSRISSYIVARLMETDLREVDRVLRYWAARAVGGSPTTVIELDDEYRRRIHAEFSSK